MPEKFVFTKDKRFTSFSPEDTIYGSWLTSGDTKGDLILKYDKPHYRIKDERILKILSAEAVKALISTSATRSIHFIDDSKLTFFAFFISEDVSTTTDTLYQVLFKTYNREN
ncbi:MAG: hypothetical protein ACRBF0_13520 [Calditrichia bacterium]